MKKTNALMLILILPFFVVGCNQDSTSPVTTSLNSVELQSERIAMRAATADECGNGGAELTTYLDQNANSVLDPGETVTATSLVCSGATGATGQNGTNGKDGTNAYPVVFKTTNEAPGCKNGGSTISFALDTNSNGVLDEKDESQQSTEICNGLNGGPREPAQPKFSCEIKANLFSESKESYGMEVLMIYHGEAKSGWRVNFNLPQGQQIANFWKARAQVVKRKVTVTSEDPKIQIKDGSEIYFAFDVKRSNERTLTAKDFTLNGIKCKF